jgi:hypothetical protein
MKHIELRTICVVTILAVGASSELLQAADDLEVHWNQVCHVAGGRELVVTTSAGEKVEGYCVAVDVDQITVSTDDHRIVKVARSALSRLAMYRSKGHQVRTLRRGVHKGLAEGVNELFSPLAIGGMAMIPGTLAWGAVSLPFCLLGDLKAKIGGTKDIKPI